MPTHRARGAVCAASAAVVVAGLAARAPAFVSVVGLVPVTIPAAAVAAEPALSNYECWDLKVSISAGDHWAGADVHAQLPPGYRFFAADNSGGDYTPTFRTGGGGNYYAFDTAVMVPSFNGGGATVLGSSSRKLPQPDAVPTFPSNGSNWGTGQDPNTFAWTSLMPANGMALIDASWADINAATNTASGVQTIARFTVTKGLFAVEPTNNYMVGQVKMTSNASASALFTFNLSPLPEPSSVAIVAAAGAGLMSLRRTRPRGG
jgi:hypothetical protein